MATPSEVAAGIASIAVTISGSQRMQEQAKVNLLAARNQLAAIPTQYADVLTEIDGYTPTGAFETLKVDEKSLLTTEFVALKTALEAELDTLGIIYT